MTIPWKSTTPAFLLTLVATITTVAADDWPTLRHDSGRRGVSSETLDCQRLALLWSRDEVHPPQPAWAGPARWDAFAGLKGLRAMRDFDVVDHPVVCDGKVFVGSSAEHVVRCLDLATGRLRWQEPVGGAVRIAPSVYEGRVYFGADDGRVYCLDADDGQRVWRFHPKTSGTRVLHERRPISTWPCRTGVVVVDGTAHAGFGLLPWEPSYLAALDAVTGEPTGPGRYAREYSGLTLEGSLSAGETWLLAPQGRVPPLLFDRADGRAMGGLKDGGGCFVLITSDNEILHGPGNKAGWITRSNATTREKIASFPGGNAMVVQGGTAYVLTDRSLAAVDRAGGKHLWTAPCDHPYELILADKVLIAGGLDEVAAYSSADGRRLWSAPVLGQAHGLAVADGRLLVATTEGRLYCFGASEVAGAEISRDAPRPSFLGHVPPAVVPPVDDASLRARWVFHGKHLQGHRVEDLVGSADVEAKDLLQRVEVARVDGSRIDAVRLDGRTDELVVESIALPKREMTATAWVRIDRPTRWGGIFGAIQDNGSFERGWVLGYNDRRLSFALAGSDGPGNLTYLPAKTDFTPGRWHHLAGTYNGATLKLHVDGRPENATDVQKGDIFYPPKYTVAIGAYRDDDEFFRLDGMIHEVRLYDRVLSPEEIREQFDEKRDVWPEPAGVVDPPEPPEAVGPAVGPWLRFTSPESAEVRWRTDQPCPTRFRWIDNADWQRLDKPEPTTEHHVELTGLRQDRVYRYVIESGSVASPEYECDTFFNHQIRPVPSTSPDAPADEAMFDQVMSSVPEAPRDGVCVLLGDDDARIGLSIVQHTRLHAIFVVTDADRATALRRRLLDASAHGARASVLHVASIDRPFLPDSVVDLLIDARSTSATEFLPRPIRPGGVLLSRSSDGWRSMAIPSTEEGTGVWSHQYGTPDNSAFGGETLGGARSVDDLQLRWIGRPGPRSQVDRQGRKPSPIAADGRLFVQGLDRMIALNAYNGSILWSLEIPDFRRYNMPRDSSNWCTDGQTLFVAHGNHCWRIDAATGKVLSTWPVPKAELPYRWGYLARQNDLLVATAAREGSRFTDFWGKATAGWYDSKAGEVTWPVCGDSLFAVDPSSGVPRWQYTRGVILHPTVTLSTERAFFVECRNQDVLASDARRIGMDELWQDQFLVALDLTTGKPLWEMPLTDVPPGRVVFYLAHQDDRLVMVGSEGGKYHVYCFDATDGSRQWDTHFDWPKDNHGGHMSRPAIIGGKVFVRPAVLDLATGKRLEPGMPGGGCGTYAATRHTLIYRDGNVTLWDPTTNRRSAWPRLRPDCWLSTIPACGMILSPEAGGGCSCGKWMETSLGWGPRSGKGILPVIQAK